MAAMAESRYSLFTAAQILRRWFSVLTQTVTQTRKNQVELSVLETTKLRNFLSRKVRKCLEMSAKNIRPTFGTKRPRVRIPTLRPNPAEIFRFQPDFSAFSELFPCTIIPHPTDICKRGGGNVQILLINSGSKTGSGLPKVHRSRFGSGWLWSKIPACRRSGLPPPTAEWTRSSSSANR